jgi:NADPH:quinone reductase-like Zn-dependent oxidoreductase
VRAAIINEFGGPDVFEVEDVPIPEPGPSQVRVRVRAIGVNPMDGKIRAGAAFFPTLLPAILGREYAGLVDSMGDGVVDVRPGARVVGLADPPNGSYAEFTLSRTYLPIPRDVSFERAVTVPIAAGTALRVLAELELVRGETLLINGASGAVGGMAVQLAVARGVNVIGTAGPANLDAVRAMGAIPVEYGEGMLDRLHRVTRRVDAVFDTAGKGALPVLIQLRGGTDRVLTIADGEARSLGVPFSSGAGFGHNREYIAEALQRLADGSVTVKIAHTFALDQVSRAHQISDGGHPGGKIILLP